MQPQASLSLPDSIRSDISIYLAPEEKVLKAIRSDAERTASKGQVWLILSTGSIIFHTCETGKEPIIALLSRRDVREIEYFQRLNEVILTFVPARNPQNVTRLSFANGQRSELEDFCDDLADLISFKKETTAGVKTYPVSKPPSIPVSVPTSATAATPSAAPEPEVTPPSALRSAASSVKHSAKPVAESRPKVEPVSSGSASPELKPDVKIATPSTVASTAASGVRFGYIVAATVISVLVGFLWYKFFSSLARIKD